MSWPRLTIIFSLAALLSMLPMLLFRVGGDVTLQLSLIECFAQQFWQGDIAPNWCFTGNAGLGSPIFLFYFPIPFYISSLLYPLLAGLGIYTVYLAAIFLAGLTTACTGYIWLRAIVPPNKAILAAILLLFMPYRLEVMLTVSAYSECWCLALLPYLFHTTRRYMHGEGGIVPIALTFAAMCLMHLPCAIIGGMFSGLYLLILNWKKWAGFTISILLGSMLTAFHTLPAFYYRRYISGEGVIEGPRAWVNDVVRLQTFNEHPIPMIGLGVSLLVCLMLAIPLGRKKIPDSFIRREMMCWMGLCVLAFLLLLPLSLPLYQFTRPLSDLILPWRLQALFVPVLAYLAALSMQFGISKNRLRNWKMEFGICIVMLTLLAFFLFSEEADDAVHRQRVEAQLIAPSEYITQWTDMSRFITRPEKRDAMIAQVMARYDHKNSIPKFTRISGEGRVEVLAWNWDKIVLSTHSTQPMRLALDHLYFPIWNARTVQGLELPLQPQPATGLMQLNIPAGEQQISLRAETSHGNPLLVTLSRIGSLLAAGLLAMIRIKALTSINVHANHTKNTKK